MSGKPTIPETIHEQIRKLHKRGRSHAQIQEELEVSRYTVRKALDGQFTEAERARQNALWAERKKQREGDERYAGYKAAYAAKEEAKAANRRRMAELRASKKQQPANST